MVMGGKNLLLSKRFPGKIARKSSNGPGAVNTAADERARSIKMAFCVCHCHFLLQLQCKYAYSICAVRVRCVAIKLEMWMGRSDLRQWGDSDWTSIHRRKQNLKKAVQHVCT